jgi:AbiV family abortive infection protein
MENIDNATIENCRKLREACLENAEALVNSAKTLEGKNTAHIRYSLAVLALEEVGKAVIFQMNAFGATSDEVDDQQSIATDDHRKKLLWVFFSPFIEQGRIAPEYFESDRELARRMHERRLETLYTDSQNPLLPQDRMVEEEADSLVRLCEIRIEMEKGVELSDVPDESKLEDLQWFRTAGDDPEKRRYFYSEYSLDKLAELGDLFEWMKWHRQEFTKTEEESRELLQQELQKEPIDGIEEDESKWKVRFRIYSESHSIRQRALNEWNRNYGSIMKLHSSNNSNELICEFIFPKSVPIRALWDVALGRSRDFVAALNIATSGLFWWHVDKDIARFYEKV